MRLSTVIFFRKIYVRASEYGGIRCKQKSVVDGGRLMWDRALVTKESVGFQT